MPCRLDPRRATLPRIRWKLRHAYGGPPRRTLRQPNLRDQQLAAYSLRAVQQEPRLARAGFRRRRFSLEKREFCLEMESRAGREIAQPGHRLFQVAEMHARLGMPSHSDGPRFSAARQPHRARGDRPHLQRRAGVARPQERRALPLEAPVLLAALRAQSAVARTVLRSEIGLPAARPQQLARASRDRRYGVRLPSLEVAAGDAAAPRDLRIGRRPLEVCLEDRVAQLGVAPIPRAKRHADDVLQSRHRIARAGRVAHRIHERHGR
jgi:hypothetical protein